MLAHSRGFTLLELMVSLLLVTLLVVAMFTAMRTIARGTDAVAAASQRLSEMQTIHDFLGRILAGSQDLTVGGEDGEAHPYFSAAEQSLRWIGVFPARHGVPGLHFFHLRCTGRAGEQSLSLSYGVYTGANRPLAALPKQHLLIAGLASCRFAYQEAGSAKPWQGEWPQQIGLPARVRLNLKLGERDWPEMIYALAPL